MRTDTPGPEHGVFFPKRLDPLQIPLLRPELVQSPIDLRQGVEVLQADLEVGHVFDEVIMARKELVEGRIDEPDDHGEPVHGSEEAVEVTSLKREQRVQGRIPLRRIGSHDHLLDDRQPVGLEEHVLRAAETDALCTVLPGPFRVPWVVGVRPDAQRPNLVRPRQQPCQQRVVEIRQSRRQFALVDEAPVPVQAHPVAFLDHRVTHTELSGHQIDLHIGDADDRRLAELSRYQRRVAGPPASARQNALGRQHAVHIVGLGIRANQDHGPALIRDHTLGRIRVEHDLTHRGARRNGQPLSEGFHP
jgi:hypothetical protein